MILLTKFCLGPHIPYPWHQKTFVLSRIKQFLNPSSRKVFYTAYIQSTIDCTFTLGDSSSDASIRPLVVAIKERRSDGYPSNQQYGHKFLVARVLPLLTRPKIQQTCSHLWNTNRKPLIIYRGFLPKLIMYYWHRQKQMYHMLLVL